MSKKNVHPIISGAGWIGSFAGLLVEELKGLGVSFEDIHRLGKPTNEGRTLVRACAGKIAQQVRGVESDFLKLISGGESLILDPIDGSEVLAEADDVFVYIDPNFKNWNADEPCGPTSAVPVYVYEMKKDGIFSQLFGSISADVLRKSSLAQAQIKGFVKKYRNWLRTDGHATFFLFRSHNHFFVARVDVRSGARLSVGVHPFVDSSIWHAEYRHRVVIPKLAVSLTHFWGGCIFLIIAFCAPLPNGE